MIVLSDDPPAADVKGWAAQQKEKKGLLRVRSRLIFSYSAVMDVPEIRIQEISVFLANR